jgi:hypothetical protein
VRQIHFFCLLEYQTQEAQYSGIILSMEIIHKLLTPELFTSGYHLERISLPKTLAELVKDQNWPAINEIFQELTAPRGDLFQFLRTFHEFESIEFIISVRDAEDEWEEDGIWHDDGSRVFAFSLSLTEKEIIGGKLGLKKKNSTMIKYISTPAYGEIILFLTGLYGFEHKIHRVEKGRRIVIAGWCS